MTDKKIAFTLAEILIAMTIVGLVAALTIPLLMTSMTARTNRLKLQKAYTSLSNALSIGENKLGYDMADLDDTELSLHNFLTKTMNLTLTAMTSYPFSGKPITGTTSGSISVASYTQSGVTSNAQIYKTKDGVYYIFNPLETRMDSQGFSDIACTKEKLCVGYIDINGPEGPNELITCTTGTDEYPHFDMVSRAMVQPSECIVDSSAVTDIYPFVFYNAEALPAINAFDAVLAGDNKMRNLASNDTSSPGYSGSSSSPYYPSYSNSSSSPYYPSYSNSSSNPYSPSYSGSGCYTGSGCYSGSPSYSNSDFYSGYSCYSNSASNSNYWEDEDYINGDDPGNPRPNTSSTSSNGGYSSGGGYSNSASNSYITPDYDPGSGSYVYPGNNSTSSNPYDVIYSTEDPRTSSNNNNSGYSCYSNSASNSNNYNSSSNSASNSSNLGFDTYYLGFDTNYSQNNETN